MVKSDLKTKPGEGSVTAFINSVENEKRREDAFVMLDIMKGITKEEPKLWGPSIVGFGSYHYKYESGREGDWFLTGFSPRKANLTVYVMSGFEKHKTLMKRLGKYKTGSSCLYIKKLEDVDMKVLKELIKKSVQIMKK